MDAVIYNIGLPRTGTRSINTLFNTLGFKTNHALISDNNDYNTNYEFVTQNVELFNIPNNFYSDTPIWHKSFWYLNNLYDKKVICTYRDKETWINSIQKFNYFKQQKFKNKDIIWFKNYFDNLSFQHLSNIYDNHMSNISKFVNILKLDIINNNNEDNLKKILKFLEIKNNNYEIINYNTMFKTK